MGQPAFDPTGTFLTGVTVVTTREADGAPRGMTANSFTSVSLDPPLVLVCIGRGSSNIDAFQAADHFAVNILGDGQSEVATAFAARGIDRFATVTHRAASTGAPVLEDCLSWFDCTLHQRVDAGDHVILIGRVEDFGTRPSDPLGFCRGRFVNLNQTPQNS
jgi:flavin reductase (DIM6/NTAB) family NADH-FMN oxidoreductase RutF